MTKTKPATITEVAEILERMTRMVEECGYGGSNKATENTHIRLARKVLKSLGRD